MALNPTLRALVQAANAKYAVLQMYNPGTVARLLSPNLPPDFGQEIINSAEDHTTLTGTLDFTIDDGRLAIVRIDDASLPFTGHELTHAEYGNALDLMGIAVCHVFADGEAILTSF